ncbi:MAG TPA: GNAT family N-acetyltransferase [Candidatus Limnocylindria bacterium]
MEYHVRSARLTDVDAAIRLIRRDPEGAGDQQGEADRLRNLLFVPSATVVVAVIEKRVVGVGVLSIRPSVRSGPFIGTIDELGAETATERQGSTSSVADATQRSVIGASILEHLVTSARNKGCTRVDVTDPLAAAGPALLKAAGFARRGALLSRDIG